MMMDVATLLDIAARLYVPGLVEQGLAFIAAVKANADRAVHVLTDGVRQALDAVHAEALAAVERLDAKLADAAGR